MDYANIAITVLYIVALGLTEYMNRVTLTPETQKWVRLYVEFVAGLRKVQVLNGKTKIVYRNQATGLFMKAEDAQAAIAIVTRILQGILTVLAGVGVGISAI